MNLRYFRIELFYIVIDTKLQVLNDRFTIVNTELFLCLTCVSLHDSFYTFDKKKLIKSC